MLSFITVLLVHTQSWPTYSSVSHVGISAVASAATVVSQIQIMYSGVGPWADVFILHCFSSLSCRNDYLATDTGVYLYTNIFED